MFYCSESTGCLFCESLTFVHPCRPLGSYFLFHVWSEGHPVDQLTPILPQRLNPVGPCVTYRTTRVSSSCYSTTCWMLVHQCRPLGFISLGADYSEPLAFRLICWVTRALTPRYAITGRLGRNFKQVICADVSAAVCRFAYLRSGILITRVL